MNYPKNKTRYDEIKEAKQMRNETFIILMVILLLFCIVLIYKA